MHPFQMIQGCGIKLPNYSFWKVDSGSGGSEVDNCFCVEMTPGLAALIPGNNDMDSASHTNWPTGPLKSSETYSVTFAQEWITANVNTVTTSPNAITTHVRRSPTERVTIQHELDSQHRFHTHIAVERIAGAEVEFLYGFYRHPDGSVIGPIFRD